MKSERFGALKPGTLGLSCKANKCSDAGTRNLGVLPTRETSPCLDDAAASKSSEGQLRSSGHWPKGTCIAFVNTQVIIKRQRWSQRLIMHIRN